MVLRHDKLEKLDPKTSGLYSIRVNVKYRLIFKYKIRL
ncbi:type II toxin-antitoxin system RelE/ParE family toxin [Pasteurella multocida]